jgi:hypothetical protein
VTAGGATPLSYQWRFNATNINGAVGSSYTRTNVQNVDAGKYSVVISNNYGTSNSADATLTVVPLEETIIAQWNFNSLTADWTPPTGVTTPSIGNGSASLVGGTTQTFATGSATDPANSGTDNSGWNTASYPSQGTGNKTAGVQFNVSTVGRQNISVRWDLRASSTGSKYTRLQYTTNGAIFIDFPMPIVLSGTSFESKTNSLTGVGGVNNNPSFAIRMVAEFENSAANTTNANYVGASGSYGTPGTLRYDMVTISGTAITATNSPPSRASLSDPVYGNGQFQFNLTGSAGSNYIVQGASNLSASNWTSLRTNAAPFTFIESNATAIPQRFYRALSLP